MIVERLLAALRDADPYAVAVALPYAIALGAVATEVAWLARAPGARRRQALRSARTASAMAAGAVVVGLGYTVVLRAAWDVVAAQRWDAAAGFWNEHPVLAAGATFVAWDLSGWLYHVLGHRTRVGWAAHQAHHSGTSYDMTLGLRESWTPFHGLLHHPLLALVGFDLRTVFVCAAISNCWQVLEHTSLPVRFPGWVSRWVMTPDAHRHHHGRDSRPVNLGPVLTCWDRMAGTWVSPEVRAPSTYGRVHGRGAVAIELAGWRALVLPGARP